MFENLLFTIFGLLIRWSYDQTSAGANTILAFLPPIRGLSVLTGEKTTIPIWKICSDNIIVRPGYWETYMYDGSIWCDFVILFVLFRLTI